MLASEILQRAMAVYACATVNLQTSNTFTDFAMPLVAGKSFVPIAGKLYVLTRDATLTTGVTFGFGQNGALISGTVALSPATISGRAAPVGIAAMSAATDVVSAAVFPLQFAVTVGGAGAGLTTLTGLYIVGGYFI